MSFSLNLPIRCLGCSLLFFICGITANANGFCHPKWIAYQVVSSQANLQQLCMDYVSGEDIHLDKNGNLHNDWANPLTHPELDDGFRDFYGYDYAHRKKFHDGCGETHLVSAGIYENPNDVEPKRFCQISSKGPSRTLVQGSGNFSRSLLPEQTLIRFSYDEIETHLGPKKMIEKTYCLRNGSAELTIVDLYPNFSNSKKLDSNAFIRNTLVTSKPCDTPDE